MIEEVEHTPMSDNELIAEFMGFRHKKSSGIFGDKDYLEIKQTENSNWQIPHWETSWDWLVPAASKFIEKAKETNMPHALFMNVYAFSVSRPIEELYSNLIAGLKWLKLKHKQP